jgi:hypothetical protein
MSVLDSVCSFLLFFFLPFLVCAAIAEVFSRIDHKFDLMYAKVIENNVQEHTPER